MDVALVAMKSRLQETIKKICILNLMALGCPAVHSIRCVLCPSLV
jgi:hypothetical protein